MSENTSVKKHIHHEEPAHPAEDHGEGNWLVSYADMMTLLVGFFAILLSFANVDEEKFEKAKESISKEFGGTYERPYGEIADKLLKELQNANLGDQVTIKTNDLGVEIAFLGTAFFESGSVDFKSGAKNIFDLMVPKIQQLGSEFNVIIEGHTDNVPLSGGGSIRNNFELSSIRACRVLEYFQSKGFQKELMTAVGYGEARPVVPNNDENGVPIPENQSQNRRVIIKIVKAEQSVL